MALNQSFAEAPLLSPMVLHCSESGKCFGKAGLLAFLCSESGVASPGKRRNLAYVRSKAVRGRGRDLKVLEVGYEIGDVGIDETPRQGDPPLTAEGGARSNQGRQGSRRQRSPDHYRILGAELRIDKPSDPRKDALRMVGVVIVDYGNRRNFEVLVAGSGKVARVRVARSASQPVWDWVRFIDFPIANSCSMGLEYLFG